MTTLLLASLVPNKLYGLILAALLALPGVRDEGHLPEVAAGILSATNQATCSGDWGTDPDCARTWFGAPEELAALIITTGYWESKFLARIGKGRCEKWECDAYKDFQGRVRHRARGYYQIQASPAVTLDEWQHMAGSGEYRAFVASSTAARLLSQHYGRCKTIQGAISGYATGGRCFWGKSVKRMPTYKRVLLTLRTHVPANDLGKDPKPGDQSRPLASFPVASARR